MKENSMQEKLKIDLENRFTYYAPKEGQPALYENIRAAAKTVAFLFAEQVPPSREQSLALTHLEEAVFWANAGIARRG